jgi:hypothetical protein
LEIKVDLKQWHGKRSITKRMDADWKFDQPPNCAVFTVRGVLEGDEPILRVTHDEDDGGWQFLGANTPKMADARIVALEEILDLDPTLLELADLPMGWRASRHNVGDDWSRSRNSQS